MILRKPYMFFIKIFKPVHIVLSILLSYMVYLTNTIVVFLNNYIHTTENVVGTAIKETLFSESLIIIPIVVIIFSLLFLGIMFYKNKPTVFYIVSSLIFLVVLIINLYVSNFLGLMEENILAIKVVKLNHDLMVINMIIEIVYFVLLLIRGLGLNLKKFNFDSDIANFDVSDVDKEEFELNVNVDLDYVKANRKRKIRHFKYFYKENKLIINSSVIFMFILICAFILITINFKNNNVEGKVYSASKFEFRVNKTLILNDDYSGKKITDNYLIVVDVSLRTNLNKISLFTKDFTLQSEDIIFPAQTKYFSRVIDIGTGYNNQILSNQYEDYIFVFEIPEKYIRSKFVFVYNDEGNKIKIKLNPKNYVSNKVNIINKLTEKISFNDTLGDISYTIDDISIQNKFQINYDYCISLNDCIKSIEYIKPSINENFDKCVLKLNVTYENNTDLGVNKFYDFIENFGSIHYLIDGVWYKQNSGFEELNSKKVSNKNNVYIGVNQNVLKAESIKFIFNIRDSIYEYILK